MTAIDGIDLKVARAKEHAEYLKRSTALLYQHPTHRLVTHAEAEGLEHVIRIYGIKPVPPEWGVVVSELFYDLQSALDNLMWALVLANGGTPGRFTYFPALRKANAQAFDRSTQGASAEVKALIETVQPYHRGDAAANDALHVIHEVNRLDKHQVPGFATKTPAAVEFYLPPELVGCKILFTYQPLYDGTELMRFILNEPRAQVDVKPKTTVAAFIMETESSPYLSVSDDLAKIHQSVAAVVAMLRPHL